MCLFLFGLLLHNIPNHKSGKKRNVTADLRADSLVNTRDPLTVGKFCFATQGNPDDNHRYSYLYPATVTGMNRSGDVTSVQWWDGDEEGKHGPFTQIRKGLLKNSDLIEIPYGGKSWCGGKVTSTDFFNLRGEVKEQHEIVATVELFRQGSETKSTVIEEYMFGTGAGSEIRLVIPKKSKS